MYISNTELMWKGENINMSNTYRHAMKATIVLSGAQIVEAIIALIRAKIIAIILGPIGIAMNSIFMTTLNTFFQFISCGLPQSAVRNISKAHNNNNKNSLISTVGVFKKLIHLIAVFGGMLCIILSPLFSKLSFGDNKHALDFIILSIGTMAMVLSYANVTILQGTQKLTSLAKTTILAAILSLLISIPCFIMLRTEGIPIAISLGYITTFTINSFFVHKLRIQKISIPWKQTWTIAAPMIKLGIIIMIGAIIINLFTYFTNVLIRYFGSLEDVGFFQSAYSITNRNFSILSAVLVADFYPRLSGLIDNKKSFNKSISEQGELLLLMVSFLSVAIILSAHWIIWLLLSSKFYVIERLVQTMACCFVFRVMWLTLSYIPLAKGDKKVYLLFDAIIGNGLFFTLNITFYYFWGLNGLAISCIIGTILTSYLLLLVYSKKYKFSYSREFWKIQSICVIFITVIMLESLIHNNNVHFIITILTVIPFIYFLYKELNNRIQIKQYITSKLKR